VQVSDPTLKFMEDSVGGDPAPSPIL
jgi:hypothetical protein